MFDVLRARWGMSPQARQALAALPPKWEAGKYDYDELLKGRAAWDNSCPPLEPGALQSLSTGARYEIIQPGGDPVGLIVFTHGGGFNVGSARTHHLLCSRIAKYTGCLVFNLDYRLAPEHPHPAAFHDLAEACRLAAGYGLPIFLGGDSAGGYLAWNMALGLSSQPEGPAIVGVILLSPWLDLDAPPAPPALERLDPLLSTSGGIQAASLYKGPGFVEWAGDTGARLPPVLYLHGGREILRISAFQWIKQWRKRTKVINRYYRQMWHVWPAWEGIPESEVALGEVSRFVRQIIRS